jgi:hypothetical protein
MKKAQNYRGFPPINHGADNFLLGGKMQRNLFGNALQFITVLWYKAKN